MKTGSALAEQQVILGEPSDRLAPSRPLGRATQTTMSVNKPWHLYVLRCSDGSLYTGITTDVERRFVQHQNNKGAKRLRGRGPLTLEYSTQVGERGQALRLEYRIKQLSKRNKEALIKGQHPLPDISA